MVSLIENKTLRNLASSISGISFYWRLGSLQFWWLPWIYSSSPPVIITTTESPCGWSAGCSFDSCSPQGWWSWLVAALPGGDWQVMLCMIILYMYFYQERWHLYYEALWQWVVISEQSVKCFVIDLIRKFIDITFDIQCFSVWYALNRIIYLPIFNI